jgi:hypothetical protein
MPNHDLGDRPPGGEDDVALSETGAFDTALRGGRHAAVQGTVLGASQGASSDIGTLESADQVARDIAEIERAAATLRKAQPALEAWTTGSNNELPAVTPPKPRPVWLLIGLLWLSTAVVAAGAVAAIARFAG